MVRDLDKADAMLMLSSALKYREPLNILSASLLSASLWVKYCLSLNSQVTQ